MGSQLDARLAATLATREQRNLLRTLVSGEGLVDLSSNDYLGLARDVSLHRSALQEIEAAYATGHVVSRQGSGGSRLLSGHSMTAERLESFLADVHKSEAALLVNSGFDGNLSYFGCIPGPGDLVLYDELIHASVHEGMRVGRARREPFRHNDVDHLESCLARARQSSCGSDARSTIFVATEGIFSMDGHVAPLARISSLCDTYGAILVVDEAHSTGLCGPRGLGLVQELGLERSVGARLVTFGKAIGCHGAVWLCSRVQRTYLINYGRPIVYSTCLPPHALVTVHAAYGVMMSADGDARRDHVKRLVKTFRETLAAAPGVVLLESSTPIQGVIVPTNERVVQVAATLRKAGYDARPIRSPTVPAGMERIRICLHAHNTMDELRPFCELLITCLAEKTRL